MRAWVPCALAPALFHVSFSRSLTSSLSPPPRVRARSCCLCVFVREEVRECVFVCMYVYDYIHNVCEGERMSEDVCVYIYTYT